MGEKYGEMSAAKILRLDELVIGKLGAENARFSKGENRSGHGYRLGGGAGGG